MTGPPGLTARDDQALGSSAKKEPAGAGSPASVTRFLEPGTHTGNETVVMTATFSPPFLIVRDEHERRLQYLCALVAWARPARVRRIVFGENSNTRFDFSGVIRLLEEAGKDVEIVVFDGNKKTSRFGKGYGEGEILEYVYRTSALLRTADAFYKVTGRLCVSNFDHVSETTTTADAFRFKRGEDARPSKAVTTFFKCGRELFEKRLLDAYRQVNEPGGRHIEHVYFNRLCDLDVPEFRITPRLVGQKASNGRIYSPYDDEIIETARSLM